jgi:hypothetical protein
MRVVLVLAALLLSAGPLRAQISGVRFEIAQIDDTTFSFSRGRARWVRPGMEGVLVDPRQRDIAVARFRVLRVTGQSVSAVITGQITRLTPEHVAVLEEPRRSWLGLPFFAGLALGLVLGRLLVPH